MNNLTSRIGSPRQRVNVPALQPISGEQVEKTINIADRLNKAVQAGKVLDVTNIEASGKGTRSIKLPTNKSKKIGVIGLAIVSSDPNQYAAAVRMLERATGQNYQQYVNNYNQVYAQLPAPKPKVTAATKVGSPLRLAAGTTASTGSRVQSLSSRLQNATTKGKVLDVSKMNIATGQGVKSINLPGPRSKKIGVAGLNIISNDAQTYAAAIRRLEQETGANYGQFLNTYNSYINL
jgi:hypothetical protein